MSNLKIHIAILFLALFLGSCDTDLPDSWYNDQPVNYSWGVAPTGFVPDSLYMLSEVIETDEYWPFTKKLTVCGTILIAGDEIPDEFMENVALTISEMLPRNASLDSSLQEEMVRNMYRYKAVLPLLEDGFSFDFGNEERNRAWDRITNRNSVCDVVFHSPGPHQINEVMEHILHTLTDVGLNYTFPDEWGLSEDSRVYTAMQDAIAKGHYDVSDYNEYDSHYLKIVIQEFAYWVVFTAWDLYEPYGPQAEWTGIRNPDDLEAKLPMSYQLFLETVPQVMVSPDPSLLDELFGEKQE
jgi:hypothetical protein